MADQRILIWDLETGGVDAFYANLGMILTFGYKWLGEDKTHVIRVNQSQDWFNKHRDWPVNDKGLVEKALKVMERADLLVAHYGDKFDRRFFHGRCAILGLPPPPTMTKQRDTLRIARAAFKFKSNRLGELAKILGVSEQKRVKTAREWPGWWLRAMAGDGSAIKEMAEYCAQDVKTLEQVYLRLRSYDNPHPRLFVPEAERNTCGLCGGEVEHRGYTYCGIYRYRRYFCKACGKWGRARHRAK